MPKQMDIRHKPILPSKPTRRRRLTFTPRYIPLPQKFTEREVEPPRWLTRLLTTLAYGIPLAFLAYVLYINYLPFGYEETFTIDVGAEGDTDSRKAFYLQPSPDLSESKVGADGTTYRELNGLAYAVFKPPVVLKDAEITVTVEGEGVSIIPPVIDFNPDDYEWDYEWDFTNKETAFTPKTSERARADWLSCTTTATSTGAGTSPQTPSIPDTSLSSTSATTTPAQICEQVPVPDLEGNAFFFDNQLTFNGIDSRLELPNSADKFEEGPFSVYVEWTPKDNGKGFQQIIGHYNWEVIQDVNSVKFQVGRLDSNNGDFIVISAPIDRNFFNLSHTLITIYSPNTNGGYIEMYLDNKLIERKYLRNSTIYSSYGEKNLTLGKAYHGGSNFFEDKISKVKVVNKDIDILSGVKEIKVQHNPNLKHSFTIRALEGSNLDKAVLVIKK